MSIVKPKTLNHRKIIRKNVKTTTYWKTKEC